MRIFKSKVLGAFVGLIGVTCYGASTVVQSPNQASIVYSGTDGTIEYDWQTPTPGSANLLGTIHIKTHLANTAASDIQLNPQLVPAASSAMISSDTSAVFQSASWASNASGPVWILVYRTAGTTLNVTLQFSLNGKMLNVQCSASQPVIGAIDMGSWPAESNAKSVPVPYYAGAPPVYLQTQNLFATTYYDWRTSNATRFDDTGRQSLYLPMTNGQLNLLSERIVIGASANISDLFPDTGNQASPYISQLSGKLVVDIWTTLDFNGVAASLRRLSSYGLQNCVIILHGWQNYGFDSGLPAHTPANAAIGGDTALKALVQTGQSMGCLFALHENYVDYYPNFPDFTKSSISLWSDGSTENAWFNPATGLQSFVTKPSQINAYAKQQSPVIKASYGTNSTFIDVNSSATPWWRADMDASTAGAGQFSTYMNASTSLWKNARQIYQGPVFGEGANHSFWSGQLDGVEAQLGTGGVPFRPGAQAPLLVDFDLAKIHSLQVNHGMGYYERWLVPGDSIQNKTSLDAYRMQEVAFGHAPFLSGELWSNTAAMLVEQNLVGPVAQRYGTQTISSTKYQFKGNWTDLNTASKAATWNRVQVTYSNGDVIVANGMNQSMTWQGYTLPAYGWMASGNGLLAYTAQKNGTIVDYAETPNSIFANARNQRDLEASNALAQPSASNFSQPDQGEFHFSLNWLVMDYAQLDQYNSFVQFVSPTSPNPEGIVLQCGHPPPFSNDSWRPGASLTDDFHCPLQPGSVPDGSYQVTVGLYAWATGERQLLAGQNDGHNRFIIGTLTISKNATVIAFKPSTAVLYPDARLNSSGATIDFTTVRTDGMVALSHNPAGWTLRSFPVSRNVVIQVAESRIPKPSASALTCDSPLATPVISSAGTGYWQIQMNGAKSCNW